MPGNPVEDVRAARIAWLAQADEVLEDPEALRETDETRQEEVLRDDHR